MIEAIHFASGVCPLYVAGPPDLVASWIEGLRLVGP